MAKFSPGYDFLATFKSWAVGLKNLTFIENFRGFEWSGEIEAGETQKITHNLKVIPTRFLVIDAQGTNNIVRGSAAATSTYFYVKNQASSSTFTGKILILP